MKVLDKISIYHLIIIFLISLYAMGSLSFGLSAIFRQALPPVLATVASDALLRQIKLKKLIILPSALITGLIIGLTGQFGETPLTLFLIGVAAITSKFLLKIKGRHIFNPAGSGLFIGSLLLSSYPSWWVGETNAWVFLIWIPILLYKMRRWAPMVGFLLPITILSDLKILISPSLLFFVSVMLIEPKTSPVTTKIGLIYGLIVALGYLVLGNLTTFDPLIPSLLFGNLTARLIDRYI